MPRSDEAPLPRPRLRRLPRIRGVSLTTRILFVNVIALALLAGGFFYLDSYRTQLIDERFKLARAEAEIAADALDETPMAERRRLLVRIGQEQVLRLRLYDAESRLEADSFALAPPSFALVDPESEPWYQKAARLLDRGVDFIVNAPSVERYSDTAEQPAGQWPEIRAARVSGQTEVFLRYAPDRTPVITAATPVGTRGEVLLTLRNALDITQSVRDARQTLVIIIGIALLLSVQLSLFLARTIVQPLRALVRAAVRVRLGREREVVVPRLPDRGDEIGLLARAVSDMTTALRQRIDAVEMFAADVAHELKNPLASLSSALETMERVEDPALRRQLAGIAAHDVQRIDRLITEIADASRIDAELSRATFVPLDVAALASQVVGARDVRANVSTPIRFSNGGGDTVVAGDAARLERVLENLLDNAVSFSPPGGEVEVVAWGDGEAAHLSVSDEGPGIPAGERDKVFERFHSVRPEEEAFGAHSGLGLAIARTIAEAHDGALVIGDRPDGKAGAYLVLSLPLLAEESE
ncbi:periplasmic sensor signal transduction histidine kinase [Novosphingobium aromaticivorans DSM 12444]|uniref:histidine kinase n=1 Tax=Novosphingobium aromaticivorans (strain ATCC 700278 / DSM 12444 / CCUG 56034 / CIP 105152 / NBRC 16084 / F199) TaxID=279238 RepID=Q2G482_NOVAD|nr:periplasmic sensor signal transduction histidine kinase [Novosphingobium aromaticivorans DSM 12444]